MKNSISYRANGITEDIKKIISLNFDQKWPYDVIYVLTVSGDVYYGKIIFDENERDSIDFEKVDISEEIKDINVKNEYEVYCETDSQKYFLDSFGEIQGYKHILNDDMIENLKEKYSLTDIEIDLLQKDEKYNFLDNFLYEGNYNNGGGDVTSFQVDKSNYDGKTPINGKITIESGVFYEFFANYSYIDRENISKEDEKFMQEIEKMDNSWDNLDYLFKVQNYGIKKPDFKLNYKGEEYYYLLDSVLIINGDISSVENFHNNSRAKKIKVSVDNGAFVKEYDLDDNYDYQMLDIGYKTYDVTKPITIEIEVIDKYFGDKSDDVYIGVISPMIDSNIAAPR